MANEEEEHSLLSNTSTDLEAYQNDEKANSLPTTTRTSTMYSTSFIMLQLSRFRATSRLVRNLIALAASFFVLGLLALLFVHDPQLPSKLPIPFSNSAEHRLEKPKSTKIVGLIFFGRRDRASILDCYLKNNLVSSGGWLDEVVWGVNTNDTDDLAYLDELLPTSSAYRKVELEDRSYFGLWNESVEAEKIYVKLDDDVVYIDGDAIPLIVDTLVTNSEAVIVSGNMVNSPELNWLQYRTGAILPYLPDLNYARSTDLSTIENPKWRASELPDWIEPADFKPPETRDEWNEYITKMVPRPKVTDEVEDESRELPQHRWLPVKGPAAIQKTPIAQTENGPFGGGWWSWAIAAQQHYSFFDNLEHNRKNVYYLEHGSSSKSDAIWDNTGERLSINFLAIRGQTILDNLEKMQADGDDEVYLSEVLPKQLNKRLLVHTQALASHYSFSPQGTLDSTDVLGRYRAYARENVDVPPSAFHQAATNDGTSTTGPHFRPWVDAPPPGLEQTATNDGTGTANTIRHARFTTYQVAYEDLFDSTTARQTTEPGNLLRPQVDAGNQEDHDGARVHNTTTAAELEQSETRGPGTEAEADAEDRESCKICFEKFDEDDLVYINCGCTYCEDCLNGHFRVGLANKGSYPPRCCGPIDIAAVQYFLDDENMIRYDKVVDEFTALRPIYCANKVCQKGFIGDAARMGIQDNQTKLICARCALQTCAACGELSEAHREHEGVLECPDSLVLADIKEMANKENWRRCPGCRHLVELTEGCDHMICQCRTEFHYVCGREYADDGRCGCPRESGWGPGQPLEEEDLQVQLPPDIENDLHREDGFPFTVQDHLGYDASEVIQFLIDGTQELLNRLPDNEEDPAEVDQDDVMQEVEGEDIPEPLRPLPGFSEFNDARGVQRATMGVVFEGFGNLHGAEEFREAGQDNGTGLQLTTRDEEDNLESIEFAVTSALAGFQRAVAALRASTTALVRERRRRAQRMREQLEHAGGGRGNRIGRGGW